MEGLSYTAAAAEAGNEFGFNSGAMQWWTDVLASALSGLVHLPLALLFVWGMNKLGLGRRLVLTALLATILSVFATEILNAFAWSIYLLADNLLDQMGVHRFMYMVIPNLLVCFLGALGFGAWLIDRRPTHDVEIFD